ncbi:hypothetical protein [Bacillus thermotolerans]|uniref:Uncharacterized protein n=1 Tax=Bacillus thermotolerans TaxID=1221996 RepID=A0A0F5HQT2_BACTR|nr:hypothetical protein [Bacillus thermotolerans]KKB35400.1 hypothetical protein QY97_01692 [Bacillus thermotolerans]KKB39046.1 hypothetical protein QY95_02486 [Bacillus thermotolerans]
MENIQQFYSISLAEFWSLYKVSIFMSLLGALIAHYVRKGTVQVPFLVIPYRKGKWTKKAVSLNVRRVWYRPLSFIFTIVDFLLFIVGMRWDEEQAKRRIYFELGFLGDVLIGVGAGILSKTALQVTDIESIYAEVSAALLAGIAGLAYIRERQRKNSEPPPPCQCCCCENCKEPPAEPPPPPEPPPPNNACGPSSNEP